MTDSRDVPANRIYSFKDIVGHESGVPVVNALVEFDTHRTKLHGDMMIFADDFETNVKKNIKSELDWGEVLGSFKDVIQSLVTEGTPMSDVVEIAIGLIADDSKQRVNLVSKVFEGEEVPIIDFERSDIEAMVQSVVVRTETDEKVIDNIVELYGSDVASDINIFIDCLESKYEDLIEHVRRNHANEALNFEVKKGVGEHMLDVAKVALGVTIALGVDKIIRRKL